MLLDFDHTPGSVQHPGSGYRPPAGGHYLSSHTPISGPVRFHLPPSIQGEFPTPTHPRVQVSRSQLVSDLQNRPPVPSTPAPVTHGQELGAQDLHLLGFPRVPQLAGTPPHPRQGGVTAHACQPLTDSVDTAVSVPPFPGHGYDHQHPCHGSTTYAYTHGAPPAFCWGPARYLPHHTHFSFWRGGGRG